MDVIQYTYDVKIARGSELLQDKLLGEHFPSIGELVITSRNFSDYEGCEKAFTELLSVLCAMNTQLTKQNHVIVTKNNPIYADEAVVPPEENWDRHTIVRAFVADADALKQRTLKFNIIGQIKVDPVGVELIKDLAQHALTQ